MKKFLQKYHTYVVCLVAVICLGGALLLFEHEMLWKMQELNLWLGSRQFLRELMVVPGGALSWLSTWFTQFFYYPTLGVALLCAWWLLLMWLTKRAFCISDRWAFLTLVPVVLLLMTIVDLGYWVYLLKLPGHGFVATIGTTVAIALVCAYRSLPDKVVLRIAFIALTCIAGYPLMGVYGLAAALLMGFTPRPSSHVPRLSMLTVSVVCAVAVPLLFYRFVYYETNLTNLYHAALPLYIITEHHYVFYIPFVLLALCYLMMALSSRGQEFKRAREVAGQARDEEAGMRGSRVLEGSSVPAGRAQGFKSQRPTANGQSSKSKVQSPKFKVQWKQVWMEVACIVILAIGLFFSWFKDENFHHELVMEHSIAQLNWQGVLDEAAAQKDEPTRAIVMMRNLALSRLGRQGNEMYNYRNGSKKYEAPFPMSLLLMAGPLVYYHYGLPNYCTRLSMEMGVEFGFNVEYYKYLARCAILTGEEQLARKYLDILRQTLFFGRWADETSQLIGNQDLIASHPEMAFITHMMHYNNSLTSEQGYVERFLMRRLSENTYTDDPIFQEQKLLASLWMRDVKMFWLHFNGYVKQHPGEPVPTHYQEAALLYGALSGQNTDKWPVDVSVRESYRLFNEVAQRYDDQEIGVVREALYPLFGNTFFYDYYLMSNLPEY